MAEDEDMTPRFWLQSTANASTARRSSSLLLLLLLILLVFAAVFIFIFIIIPSFLSFTSQIFRPHSVKKSWDTLNLVLVLFAIVCGFLGRNNATNETPRSAASPSYVQKPTFESTTPRRGWFSNSNNNASLNRLRSFSSYPDLRAEEASWLRSESDYQWRFYDDTHLYNYGSSSLKDRPFNEFKPRQKIQDHKEEQAVEAVVKRVDDDISATTAFIVETQKEIVYAPPPQPPSPPARPFPKVVRRKVVKRAKTYQDVAKSGERKREVDDDLGGSTSSPPPPPPPLPDPPRVEEGESRSERKRGTTSATKEFLTSLRRNKKKKKQRPKSVENLDIFFDYESSYPLPLPPPPSQPPPPPPPQPPPPPPHFFQNLFYPKKRKATKIHSVPPPPPPKTILYSSSASKPKLLSQNFSKNVPSTTHKLPLPVKIKSYNNVEETVSSGNESPMMSSIPPPPPLPPFNMPVWKFEVVEGGFVRLKSNNDSEIDETSAEESSSPSVAADSAASSPLFCPSPDVNTKADNFIARFRAGLQLEKMNSIKERGKSNLGPS